jgi:hypothetical protein
MRGRFVMRWSSRPPQRKRPMIQWYRRAQRLAIVWQGYSRVYLLREVYHYPSGYRFQLKLKRWPLGRNPVSIGPAAGFKGRLRRQWDGY